MAVIRRPHSCRVRYVANRGDRVVNLQNFSRINETLEPAQLLGLRQAVNLIRPLNDQVQRGYLTTLDELVDQ